MRRLLHRLTLLASIGIASSCQPVYAQRELILGGMSFRSIDLNRDGFIDRREANSRPEFRALLARADSNHDGRLSEAEFDSALAEIQLQKVLIEQRRQARK